MSSDDNHRQAHRTPTARKICGVFATSFKVVWYPQYGPKRLFKYGEERSIVCYCTQEEKLNF